VPGAALSSPLYYPYQIDRDAAGNLYVADLGNVRIAKIVPGGNLSTIGGSGSFGAMTAGPATASPFINPQALALDSAGNVYVADSGSRRVGKINSLGQLSFYAGNGASGTVVPGTATATPVPVPISLAVDGSDNLFIANSIPSNIYKVTPAGQLSIFAGTGSPGTNIPGPAANSPMSPNMLAADAAGNVYATDTSRCTIMKITAGGLLSIIAGNSTCISGNPTPGPATGTSINHPDALDVDSAGNVYFSEWDRYRVYKISAAGQLSLFAGDGTTAVPTYDGPALASGMKQSEGMVVDDGGVVFLAHSDNNTVDRIGPLTPGPPLDVQVNPSGSTLGLSFLPPADAGTTPVSSYEVSIDNGATWNTFVATPSGGRLTGSISGVPPATSYQVLVRALNLSGASESSSAVTVSPISQPSRLPVTGAAAASIASVGVVLLALGMGVIRAVGSRRRPRAGNH
jgi:sugar lactone lactonase YvrE